MDDVKVISLGGSLIAPDKVDEEFVRSFYALASRYLDESGRRRIILICGGGGPARLYQQALRNITAVPDTEREDWLGIKATHLNAELVRHVFAKYCRDEVVTDPTGPITFSGQVLVAAGWKPGFSTDYDAVVLAERFNSHTVINLSNIAKVYTADPRQDPNATPIDAIGWKEFTGIVGEEWVPGKNAPFDPVATKKAWKNRLKVIFAGGKDLDNLSRILFEKDFEGTVIGPR
ncbi:MAG: UMP kinase [Spirochaetales bacterium]|nr:UMP kinase [Spirochaetales bacterium]